MSVKVWDSALGAYRDAGLVRRYDRESGAWADCQEARAQKGGAWQRVWPERLHLYNQGDECVGVTGGILVGDGIQVGYVRNVDPGWVANGAMQRAAVKGIGHIAHRSGVEAADKYSMAMTCRLVRAARYSWLCADIHIERLRDSGSGFNLFMLDADGNVAAGLVIATVGRGTHRLDISGLSGEYRPTVSCASRGSSHSEGTTHRVWLEM